MASIVEGVVVSCVSSPYDFEDKRTGERVVGTTHIVAVVESPDQPIRQLKVKPAEFVAIEAAMASGGPVAVRAALWQAKGPEPTVECAVVEASTRRNGRGQLVAS